MMCIRSQARFVPLQASYHTEAARQGPLPAPVLSPSSSQASSSTPSSSSPHHSPASLPSALIFPPPPTSMCWRLALAAVCASPTGLSKVTTLSAIMSTTNCTWPEESTACLHELCCTPPDCHMQLLIRGMDTATGQFTGWDLSAARHPVPYCTPLSPCLPALPVPHSHCPCTGGVRGSSSLLPQPTALAYFAPG